MISADRVALHRARRRALGLVEIRAWAPADMATVFRDAAKLLCRGADPPTERQIAFARDLARRIGQPLPDIAVHNAIACELFIAVARAKPPGG